MQKDPLVPNQFNCQPSEKIMVVTTVNKPPLLAQFPFSPVGGVWASAIQDLIHLTDTRIFVCPATPGNSITFAASFNEAIAAGDPNPVALYSITFSSLTNPHDPVATSPVAVPQGTGPILTQYTFVV
jgi:hypothetical protein